MFDSTTQQLEKQQMTQAATTAPAEEKVLSLDEMVADSPTEYATIPGFKTGTTIRIGSLDAGEMIEWSEANEGEAKRNAGLRLIAKSLVDKDGKFQITPGDEKAVGRAVQQLKKVQHKKAEEVVKAVLKLNGMRVAGEKTEAEVAAKNG
jgi:hypothetical protein